MHAKLWLNSFSEIVGSIADATRVLQLTFCKSLLYRF